MGILTHPLMGADLRTLQAVFRETGGPDQLHHRLVLTGAALARWPARTLERRLVARRRPERMESPVFILGHWRSGTTHLYNILSRHGWAYVHPVATGLPHEFLTLGRLLRPLLERQLPKTRWIDDIPVTPDSPQEDEIALAGMSPLSFYHGLNFPQGFDRLIDRGVFLDGCTKEEIEGWSQRFVQFLEKLALKHDGRLLIKNPVYTARPALLRRLFPDARFIHIHRNPFEVFLSMRNFYARLLDVMALQRVPEDLDIDATILRVYRRMMRRFDEETRGWPASTLIEVPYAALDRDPMRTIGQIYRQLDLTGFDEAAPHFRAYLASVDGYRKNAFRIDAEAVRRIEDACAPWLDRWGYEGPVGASAA